jgi:acetylornithine deacetylase/succinyl-diaminopimelate desuccinylase-like protein
MGEAEVLQRIDGELSASLDRLFELLRFPSVGTDPRHHGDCRAAAEWLARLLAGMGFAATLRETAGQPVVVGKLHARPRPAPHVLFYGHYDVQPADPMNLWASPPFEPRIGRGNDGRDAIFARGAGDDKGQLMTFLEACRAWLAVHGLLPFRLTVLIEGDEEGDSGPFDAFLARNRGEFAADAAFVCDTDMWDDATPAIVTMLRGCIGEEVRIAGPRIDLHSGYYGGPAVNPIKVLSRILASLHDRNGRVAIPGFYEGVKPIPPRLRREWAKLGFSAKQFLGAVGLGKAAGENRFTPLEQIWARPTAEVNGIWGGYRGAGAKTVLPAEAFAKVSFRLVGEQKPAQVRKAFRDFVRARLPADCRARFAGHGGDSAAVTVAADSPWVAHARRALAAEWGRPAVAIGSGVSIPAVASFKRFLGIDSLLVGFARESDGHHSPNEKYDVECFHRGMRTWARIIAATS